MMNPNSSETIFVGDSELARLMRARFACAEGNADWSQTLLGSVSEWSQSLKTSVSILLNSRYPMFVWWGREYANLYNDAYRPILGSKHPQFLGQSARDCWADVWDVVGPLAESVLDTGQPTWSENLLLLMERNDYTEEAYFTFSYSPIRDERNEVGGIFCAVIETTKQIIGERRLQTLRELSANTAEAKTVEDACQLAKTTLSANPHDIPFALLYLVDAQTQQANLVATTTNIAAGNPASPQQVDLTQAIDDWHLTEVHQTGTPVLLTNLTARFGRLPGGAWTDSPNAALVMPIAKPGQEHQRTGFLIMGISPRRAFDDEYRGFFDLAANQVATAIADADAYEAERKRAEVLAELDRAKTTFFSNISHEFRTPLTLMLNPLQEVLTHSSLLPNDREQLEIAYRNSQRLLKLVNTLLDFSRIEAGRIKAVYEPTDLAALTSELASVFRSAIERAGMRLVVDYPPRLEPVYVDREMWEKIVLNLLSNAFKFTFEGEIVVSLRAIDQQIELEVRDTGIGIPADELPHIFERFHRVKGARGRSYEGSGIGLALVQELVKLHSGTIQVNSVVDQGTCFTVTIPMGFAHLPRECIGATRTLASTATGASPYVEEMLRWSSKSLESSDALTSEILTSIPVQPQSSSTPTARIVLADDNADMRDYLKRLLSQQYEVEAVADGIAALTAIRQQMPDLVLTDVMMPRMDGFELLRLLRNPSLEDSLRSDPTTQDIPIILLSARAGEEARIEGLEAGADDYLTKPFSARELLARVEANLKLAQLRREATQREQALRLAAEAAQQKVETILSSISDGFYTLDRNWCFTYVNDRVCEIAEMPREALLGFNVWERFPEAVEADAYPQLHRAMCEQVVVQFEYFHSPRNCWIENRVYPSPDGVAVFLADITDRKQIEVERRQTEAALCHSEAQFRRLADAMPQIVWIADAEGNPEYVSQRWVDYTGLTLEQTVEQSWINQVIHPDDLEPTYEIWRACLETGTLYQTEFRLRQAFAEQSEDVYRWFLCRAVPIHNPQGEITHWYGTLTDLHDRKQIETALRESEERLKLAVEAGRMMAWEWNPSADTLITSSNFPEIYGLPEIQSGEEGFALVHPDDLTRHQMTVETTVATGNNYQSEFRCIRPDNGAIIWLEERGQAILNSDGSLQKLIGITIDVTERKQAEEDLRLNRDRLAFVLANTGIGLWLNPLPLSNLNWDNRTREFFFVPPDVEPTVELFWSRLHPDDREPTRLAIEASLRDRTLYQIDHRAVNPDTGEIRWVRSAGKAIYAPDGTPTRFDGINYDITDPKQAEQERERLLQQEQMLRQQAEITERRLYALLESIREDFVLFDRDWRVVYLNSQAATTMRRSRDEILGRCFWDVFPDLVGTEFYDRLHQAMHEQAPVQFEYCYDTWDTWFENRVYPADEGIIVLCTNITDRKHSEEALRQALQKLNFHVENTPMAVVEWDRDLRITRWSGAAEQMFGWSADEVLGRFIFDLQLVFENDVEHVSEVSRRLMWEESYVFSYNRNYTRHGDVIYCEWYNSSLRDESGRMISVLSLVLNVTDRVQLECDRERILQQEQAAREAAEAASRIKDEFLAVVSHELRSPLNPILGWSKLLRSRQLDKQKTDRALEVIERNAQMQAQLINDLLDVSRILRGKLSLDPNPVDLVVTIQAAMETVRLAAEAKSIQINTQFEPDVGQVAGDAGRLQQVIWNLLTNAVKFTSEGGRVDIRLERIDSQAQVTVTDTGKGIPPDFLPYVFEQFRQESSATTRRFGGLGLGLAIVRYLVELHGGTVQADSPGEGQGATFTVKLPLLPHQPITQLNPKPSEFSLNLQGTRILIVDDDDNTREFLAFLLELRGANVIATATAGEALATLTQFKPNVLLSDIGMPDVDGYMLMRQIRALPSEQGGTIPAIALTAYAGEIDYQQAMAAGFQRHIAKPIKPEVLIQAIASLLGQSAAT